MPARIIEAEIEKTVKRLLAEVQVDKQQENIVDKLLGPGAYDRLKRIAKEEAQEAVRQLREQHFLIGEDVKKTG